MASEVGYDPTSTRVNSTPSFPFDYSELGGEQGCRSPPANLARIGSAPARSPYWCPAPDSNRPTPPFTRPQSPDLLTGRIGADTESRTRATSLATRETAVILCPHGAPPRERSWPARRRPFYRRRCVLSSLLRQNVQASGHTAVQRPSFGLPVWLRDTVVEPAIL